MYTASIKPQDVFKYRVADDLQYSGYDVNIIILVLTLYPKMQYKEMGYLSSTTNCCDLCTL